MAVTAASLAATLGITVTNSQDPTDPGLVEAGRLLSIASSLVAKWRHDPDDTLQCPEAITDEAVVRTAGHLKSREGFGRADGKLQIGRDLSVKLRPAAASAVRQSGAAALLSPWVKRGA